VNEKFDYLSDEALEELISQVEQTELVEAPPDLMENILFSAGLLEEPEIIPEANVKPALARKKEFYAYCFRVITSVAAAVALVFLLPVMLGRMEQRLSSAEGNGWDHYRQEAPKYEDVVKSVPDKEEVVAAKPAPTREEVLNDSAFIDKVFRGTGWFGKDKSLN